MQTDYKALVGAGALLWRRKFLIVAVAALSGAAALLININTPRDYRSEISLLYRFGREYFPISPGEQRRNWGENVIVSLDAAVFTEVRLLSSHTLLEMTIDRLGLETIQTKPPTPTLLGFVRNLSWLPQKSGNEASPTSPTEADRAKAVRAVANAFSIKRIEGSALVSVSVSHPMPDVADRLAREHVETYLTWRRDLFDRNATDFFTRELERARQELDGLAAQRKNLMRQYKVVDIETELKVAQEWLGEIERALLTEPSNERLQLAAAKSRAEVTRISELRSAIVPLDERIRAATSNIASLEQERANWALTRSYSATVAPTVGIIDDRTAWDNPVGLSPKVKAALATILGGLIASLAILIASFISSHLGKTRPNVVQQCPKTTRKQGGQVARPTEIGTFGEQMAWGNSAERSSKVKVAFATIIGDMIASLTILIASIRPTLLGKRPSPPNRTPRTFKDSLRAGLPVCTTAVELGELMVGVAPRATSGTPSARDNKPTDDSRKVTNP